MTMPTWITKWPWWAWASAVVVVAVAAALIVASDDDGDTTIAGDRATTEPTDTASTTAMSTTSSTTTTTTTATTTTAPPTTTTDPPPTTTAAPPAPVPSAAAITARSGGGSGEVVVRWNAVPGATGYRVLRRIGSGPFRQVADFDITTGAATSADDVTNIWSGGYSYKPVLQPFPGKDDSPWFEYVDVGDPTQRCYQVVADNPSGDAPASNTSCASPP